MDPQVLGEISIEPFRSVVSAWLPFSSRDETRTVPEVLMDLSLALFRKASTASFARGFSRTRASMPSICSFI